MKKLIKLIRKKKNDILMLLDPKSKRHSLVGPAKLWKMKQKFQIKFLMEFGLLPHHNFLDIGCGTLRGGIPIINYLNTENYHGIEVRENVLHEARKELLESGLEKKKPNLTLFDDFKLLNFSMKFDVIFAFSVLIHLEDSILEKCFEFIQRNLSSNGVFYANVNITSHLDGSWQEFPVVFRSIEFYKKLAIKNNLSIKILGSLEELGHMSNSDRQNKQVMIEFKKIESHPKNI